MARAKCLESFAQLSYAARVKLSDFNFFLPPSQIAKYPAVPRDSSRLLRLDKTNGAIDHTRFSELTSHLRAGDLLVFNDTKVIPARLFVKNEKGATLEAFLTEEVSPGVWVCLVKPGKKVKQELSVTFADGSPGVIRRDENRFLLEAEPLADPATGEAWLKINGLIPLPPYLDRAPEPGDRESYQTVYARLMGSIAAPTAGLHFTIELLDSLKKKGVHFAFVTLHVGYGTFAPILVKDTDDHHMHSESYEIPQETLKSIEDCRRAGGRVIAVGTTTLRALESFPKEGARASTRIFITPGYHFKMADGLITNFHLPESTLLILVSAFAGQEKVLATYQEAVLKGYRFFSYGDAMLIT